MAVAPPTLLMKLACSGDTSAPPSRHPLAPAASIRRAALSPSRIAKTRSGIGQARSAAYACGVRAAAASPRARSCGSPLRETPARRAIRRVARQRRTAVKILHRDGCGSGRAGRLHPHFAHELADLAIRAGVHPQRSADRSGNSGKRADARSARRRGVGRHRRHVGRTARLDDDARPSTRHADGGERAGQPQHDAAHAAVADQHVAAAADDEPRQSAAAGKSASASASSSSLCAVTSASAGPPIFHDVYGASGSSKRARSPKIVAQRVAIAVVEQRLATRASS